MKNKSRTYLFNAPVDSFLFAVLYILVLTITSFHHHPINLLGVDNSITETSNEKNRHAYTTRQCPIINFGKTGFNSLSLDLSKENNSFVRSTYYISILVNPNVKNIISHFSRRGPPFSKIV